MKDFWSLARFFRSAFPELRFKIRRVRVKDHFALTSTTSDGRFLIRIDPDLCEGGAIAFLIHELGHALSWHVEEHPSVHGPQFGAGYSVAWRKYLDWVEQQND